MNINEFFEGVTKKAKEIYHEEKHLYWVLHMLTKNKGVVLFDANNFFKTASNKDVFFDAVMPVALQRHHAIAYALTGEIHFLTIPEDDKKAMKEFENRKDPSIAGLKETKDAIIIIKESIASYDQDIYEVNDGKIIKAFSMQPFVPRPNSRIRPYFQHINMN